MEDGPRNYILKFEGVLDTSDLAATGTIGTAGVTTTGSATVTFTAGALVPVVGQYITGAAGTGTGIPTGAYIVSINSATSITLSSPVTTGGTGWTLTGVAGAVVVADPDILSQIDYAFNRNCTKFAIRQIMYNVEDTLSVNLFWASGANDSGTPIRIEELVGRGKMEYYKLQDIQSTAPAGSTGNIIISTQGWAASAVLSFTIILALLKQ